jgi:hypothetical protein
MDHYLSLVPSNSPVNPVALLEYSYHRRADETFRALNCIRLGKLQEARELLRQPFPWRTLFVYTRDLHFRKLFVVLQRLLLRLGLELNLGQLQEKILRRISH